MRAWVKLYGRSARDCLWMVPLWAMVGLTEKSGPSLRAVGICAAFGCLWVVVGAFAVAGWPRRLS